MMVIYNRLKNELPHKLGTKVNLWKQISDFHNMTMTKEVTVYDYADTYLRIYKSIDVETYMAGKFFLFSLPPHIRDLLGKCSVEWPRTLEEMIKLTK